jgi:hypothetical protein
MDHTPFNTILLRCATATSPPVKSSLTLAPEKVPPAKVQNDVCNTLSASTSLEPVVRGAAAARRHKTHELGDLTLEGVAEISDECGFEVGRLARLQHAGDR